MKYLNNKIQEGNTSVGYALTGDKKIRVVAMGSKLKSSVKPLTEFLIRSLVGTPKEDILENKLAQKQFYDENALLRLRNNPTIFLPSIPEGLLDKEVLWAIDGGLALEAFRIAHARNKLKKDTFCEIMQKGWLPQWEYMTNTRANALVNVWKVFNDVHVLRDGLKEYPGSKDLFQALMNLTWGYEKGVRNKPKADNKEILEQTTRDILFYVRDMLLSYVCITLPEENPYSEEVIEEGNYILSLCGDGVLDSDDAEGSLRAALQYMKLADDFMNKKTTEGSSQGGNATNSPVAAADASAEGLGNFNVGSTDALASSINNSDEPNSIGRRYFSASMDTLRLVKDEYETRENTAKSDYTYTYKQVNGFLQGLRSRSIALLRGREKAKVKHLQTRGRKIDTRGLPEIVTKKGSANPRIFSTKEEKVSRNTAISLMLDESGSMDVGFARQILIAFSETLTDLQIAHEIVGFSAECSIPPDYEQMISTEYYEDPTLFNDTYTHTSTVNYRVFKTFEENARVDKIKYRMGLTQADGLTPIVEALDFSYHRIKARREDQKLVIVITDGFPEYNSQYGSFARWSAMDTRLSQVREHLIEMGKTPIQPLLVMLDPNNSLYDRFRAPKEYSIKVTNVGEFANVLHEWIKAHVAL